MAAAKAEYYILLELFLGLFCRLSVQIVGEKDGLLHGVHAGTLGDGGLERFVNAPVAVVAVRPGTALEFDVDARVPRCFLHLADPLSCAPKNDAVYQFLGQQVSDNFVFL